MVAAQEPLQVLLELTRQMLADRPVDALLAEVTQALLRILPGSHSSVRLFDETRSSLVAGARAGQGSDSAPITFEKGQGIIGWVAEHGKAARVSDCLKDSRFIPAPVQGFAIRSLLAVPLMSNGEVIGVLTVSSPEVGAYSPDDEVLARLVANSTVPTLEKARIERLALTDQLTGIYNQRYLMLRLSEEFERARRTGAPLSLLLIDLDHFKQINLTYQRSVGDLALASFAERTRQVVRRYDVLVRRGGEEFVLVMPGTTIADAIDVATRIREVTNSLPLSGGEKVNVRVTVSIGAVEWDRLEEPEQLDRRAILAMYEAQKNGGNRVVVGEVPAIF
ncbi:MAG: GGDEF domain-containing protein [Deltaproteobacteria bacterium]|nr:GGDEF domain-containing protein [Deltaproteobacteria bacterium]